MTPSAGARPAASRRFGSAARDRAVTGVLIAALAVAGFAISLPHPDAPLGGGGGAPSASASEAPTGPVTYREGVVGRPGSVTPVTARTQADKALVGLIFSGLVKMGPGDTLVPDLAASWTTDKSGQTWTVAIRPDAVWQDGAPVTADDVVYTVSTLKDPAASGGLSAAWADVTAEAVDTHTVRFTLGSPVGSFLAALRQPLLPAHLLKGVVANADLASSAFALNPVGTGPYQLVQLDEAHAVLVPASATANGAGRSPGTSGGSDGAGPGDPASSESGAPAGSPAPASTAASPAVSSPSSVGGAPSAPVGASAGASGGAGSPAASAVGAVDGVGGPMAQASPTVRPTARPTSKPKATATPKPKATATPKPSPTPSPTAVPDPGASPLQEIELDFFDSEDALATAFQAGDIDGAANLGAATTKALAAMPGTKTLNYPTTTLSAVLLNLRPSHPELQDANVRKALLSAINRPAIAATDLGGQARVADTLIPAESWAYDATKVAKVPFSRTQASALLRGAGWTRTSGRWTAPKGKAPYTIQLLTVPADANPRLAAIATEVKKDWGTLGLSVTIISLSGTDLAARLQSGSFTAAVLDIASGLEPDLYPLLDSSQVRSSGSNRSGYQDPAMDRLLEAARQNASVTRRKAAWSALLAGISAKVPVLPVVWADDQAVVRGLSGATPRLIVYPGDRFWDVLAWRLAASR